MNEDLPRDIPVKMPGPSYVVIVRLVLLHGNEEYRPARAVRWSSTHVTIKVQERGGPDGSTCGCTATTYNARRAEVDECEPARQGRLKAASSFQR